MTDKIELNSLEDDNLIKCRRNLFLISLVNYILSWHVVNFNKIELFKIEISITKNEATWLLLGISLYLLIRLIQLRSRTVDQFYAQKCKEIRDKLLEELSKVKATKRYLDELQATEDSKTVKNIHHTFHEVQISQKQDDVVFAITGKNDGSIFSIKFRMLSKIENIDGSTSIDSGSDESVYVELSEIRLKFLLRILLLNCKDTHFTDYMFPLLFSALAIVLTLYKAVF